MVTTYGIAWVLFSLIALPNYAYTTLDILRCSQACDKALPALLYSGPMLSYEDMRQQMLSDWTVSDGTTYAVSCPRRTASDPSIGEPYNTGIKGSPQFLANNDVRRVLSMFAQNCSEGCQSAFSKPTCSQLCLNASDYGCFAGCYFHTVQTFNGINLDLQQPVISQKSPVSIKSEVTYTYRHKIVSIPITLLFQWRRPSQLYWISSKRAEVLPPGFSLQSIYLKDLIGDEAVYATETIQVRSIAIFQDDVAMTSNYSTVFIPADFNGNIVPISLNFTSSALLTPWVLGVCLEASLYDYTIPPFTASVSTITGIQAIQQVNDTSCVVFTGLSPDTSYVIRVEGINISPVSHELKTAIATNRLDTGPIFYSDGHSIKRIPDADDFLVQATPVTIFEAENDSIIEVQSAADVLFVLTSNQFVYMINSTEPFETKSLTVEQIVPPVYIVADPITLNLYIIGASKIWLCKIKNFTSSYCSVAVENILNATTGAVVDSIFTHCASTAIDYVNGFLYVSNAVGLYRIELGNLSFIQGPLMLWDPNQQTCNAITTDMMNMQLLYADGTSVFSLSLWHGSAVAEDIRSESLSAGEKDSYANIKRLHINNNRLFWLAPCHSSASSCLYSEETSLTDGTILVHQYLLEEQEVVDFSLAPTAVHSSIEPPDIITVLPTIDSIQIFWKRQNRLPFQAKHLWYNYIYNLQLVQYDINKTVVDTFVQDTNYTFFKLRMGSTYNVIISVCSNYKEYFCRDVSSNCKAICSNGRFVSIQLPAYDDDISLRLKLSSDKIATESIFAQEIFTEYEVQLMVKSFISVGSPLSKDIFFNESGDVFLSQPQTQFLEKIISGVTAFAWDDFGNKLYGAEKYLIFRLNLDTLEKEMIATVMVDVLWLICIPSEAVVVYVSEYSAVALSFTGTPLKELYHCPTNETGNCGAILGACNGPDSNNFLLILRFDKRSELWSLSVNGSKELLDQLPVLPPLRSIVCDNTALVFVTLEDQLGIYDIKHNKLIFIPERKYQSIASTYGDTGTNLAPTWSKCKPSPITFSEQIIEWCAATVNSTSAVNIFYNVSISAENTNLNTVKITQKNWIALPFKFSNNNFAVSVTCFTQWARGPSIEMEFKQIFSRAVLEYPKGCHLTTDQNSLTLKWNEVSSDEGTVSYQVLISGLGLPADSRSPVLRATSWKVPEEYASSIEDFSFDVIAIANDKDSSPGPCSGVSAPAVFTGELVSNPPQIESNPESTDSDTEDGSKAKSGPNKVLIGVIVALLIVALFVIVGVIAYCRAKRKQKRQPRAPLPGSRLQSDASTRPDSQPRYLRNPFPISPGDEGSSIPVTPKASKEDLAALPHVLRENITVSKLLGSGAFGEVFDGLACNIPKLGPKTARVAIKTLRPGSTPTERSKFLEEAVIMNNFNHHNIVGLLGVCLEDEPEWIILELMEGGDLLNYVRSVRPTETLPSQVSLRDLLSIMIDVGNGLSYLERNHHVHRDLACRNCLVSSKDPKLRVVKIADFGLTRDVYEDDYYRVEGQGLMPIRWMAPEAIIDGVFSSKSDVWAYGVLMWEVLTLGQQPYQGKTNFDVINYVRIGGLLAQPDACPDEFYQIMKQIWTYDTSLRPSMTSILASLRKLWDNPNFNNEAPFPPQARILSSSQPPTAGRLTVGGLAPGPRVGSKHSVFVTTQSGSFNRDGELAASLKPSDRKRSSPAFASWRKPKLTPPPPPSRLTLELEETKKQSTSSTASGSEVTNRPTSNESSYTTPSFTTSRDSYEAPLITSQSGAPTRKPPPPPSGNVNPAFEPSSPEGRRDISNYLLEPKSPTRVKFDVPVIIAEEEAPTKPKN